MRITLLVSIAVLAAACSSTGETAQPSSTQSSTTDPNEPAGEETPAGKETGEGEPDPDEPKEPKQPTKDAGASDAKAPAKDAGPTAFTKSELQTLVDARCSPCHIDLVSGGMSLANDFTTNTVGVASTEVPSMKRILKGDHTKSYLWHKVNGSHLTVGGSGVRMPKNGTAFTATEIDRLAKYIDAL